MCALLTHLAIAITNTSTASHAGTWSEKAAKEASKFGEVRQVKVDKTEPCQGNEWKPNCDTQASYIYYCSNETVQGSFTHTHTH